MKLFQALGLASYREVALVGAGGKTTSLFLLGRELAAQGKQVVHTTTTRMYPPPPEIPLLLGGKDRQVAAALLLSNQVFVGSRMEGDKVLGLSCPQLEKIRSLPQVDAIVIEADGSQGLPLKFPGAHEPVVCSQDTLVVPVLGTSALGQRLGEENFHHLELASSYLGFAPGDVITPRLAAQVLCHPLSYGRFLRSNAVIPLLNQADTPERKDLARELAAILLAQEGIKRVVIAAVETSTPVRGVLNAETSCFSCS
jgi:probable selenium-dependent hydroxylase accessory protein YqeC